jgi:hypothetical protein
VNLQILSYRSVKLAIGIVRRIRPRGTGLVFCGVASGVLTMSDPLAHPAQLIP